MISTFRLRVRHGNLSGGLQHGALVDRGAEGAGRYAGEMRKEITQEDRDHVEDMGYAVCEECGSIYSPLLGWVNDGHQCNDDGTKPQYMLPITHKFLLEMDYTLAEREESIASWDKEMLEKYNIVIPRPHPDDQTD